MASFAFITPDLRINSECGLTPGTVTDLPGAAVAGSRVLELRLHPFLAARAETYTFIVGGVAPVFVANT